jgi:nucleotide-binding universal stress UspA family protein
MHIKTVLAYLPSEELAEPVLQGAVALAKAHGAHVVGLHLEASYYPAYGEVAIAMPPDVIEQMRKPLRERSKKLEESFKTRMADENISSEWRSGSTEYSSLPGRIVDEAVSADMVLCPQVEAESVDVTTLDLPERLILEGGRPVLVLPPETAVQIPPKRVLIAWNNSPQAARAVFDSLDLMKDAEAITVLSLAGDADERRAAEEQAGQLAANLGRHGLHAKVEAVDIGNRSASEYLRSRLDADGADLMVMGCYGHSRFRELVFGGVTRDILGGIKAPTVMSH